MRRAALAAAFAVVALVGCGGGGGSDDARGVLRETVARLAEIESGTLHLKLSVDPRSLEGKRTAYSLNGPFSLAGHGPLPVTRMAYTQRLGDASHTVTVVADGRHGFVEVGGKTYRLTGAQEGQLRLATGALRTSGGLGTLPIGDWFRNPRSAGGGTAGGAETDRVSAEVDVVAALNGILALQRALGRGGGAIAGADATHVDQAVRSSSIELWSGKDDRLLRRVRLAVELAPEVPPRLRTSLGELVGAKLDFELGVDDPNAEVSVETPASPLPASALPRG